MQNFVYRSEWGARPPRNRSKLPASAVDTLVIHYTASDSDEQSLHKNCAARVRGVQNYHMDHNGWSDIAYNWLVCKHGYIFRGRGFGIRSAATGDANSHTFAICFLGDDTVGRQDVTPEAKERIREVFKFVDKNTPGELKCKGHRDFMSTTCPGNELHAFSKTL